MSLCNHKLNIPFDISFLTVEYLFIRLLPLEVFLLHFKIRQKTDKRCDKYIKSNLTDLTHLICTVSGI